MFLAPDEQKVESLRGAVRDHLAWSSIVDETGQLDLRHEQAQTARRRVDEEAKRVENQIPETWVWVLAPRQTSGTEAAVSVTVGKTEAKERRLAVRASDKLVANGDLYDSVYAPRLIRGNLDRFLFSVWNQGHLSVEKLWEFHYSYLYLTRLRALPVLLRGVESVLDDPSNAIDGFWLATSYDDSNGTYSGLLEPGVDMYAAHEISGSTLLVRPEIARQQREREVAKEADAESSGFGATESIAGSTVGLPGTIGANGEGGGSSSAADNELRPSNTVYRARHEFDPAGDIAGELQSVADEIIENLLSGKPEVLEISLEITARRSKGFDDRTIRNVTENARTLDISDSYFEDY